MAVPARPVSGNVVDSAWGQVVHDAIVAQDIQAGSVTFTPPASTSALAPAVVFPRPFAAPPFVAATVLTGGGTPVIIQQAPTATQVVLGVVPNSGAGNLSASPVTIHWIAIGPRA